MFNVFRTSIYVFYRLLKEKKLKTDCYSQKKSIQCVGEIGSHQNERQCHSVQKIKKNYVHILTSNLFAQNYLF